LNRKEPREHKDEARGRASSSPSFFELFAVEEFPIFMDAMQMRFARVKAGDFSTGPRPIILAPMNFT